MANRTVFLLTRPGCGLCDEAMPHLERASRWLRLQLVVTDITEDSELEDEYDLRIPGVRSAAGRVLAEGSIGAAAAWRAAVRARL